MKKSFVMSLLAISTAVASCNNQDKPHHQPVNWAKVYQKLDYTETQMTTSDGKTFFEEMTVAKSVQLDDELNSFLKQINAGEGSIDSYPDKYPTHTELMVATDLPNAWAKNSIVVTLTPPKEGQIMTMNDIRAISLSRTTKIGNRSYEEDIQVTKDGDKPGILSIGFGDSKGIVTHRDTQLNNPDLQQAVLAFAGHAKSLANCTANFDDVKASVREWKPQVTE